MRTRNAIPFAVLVAIVVAAVGVAWATQPDRDTPLPDIDRFSCSSSSTATLEPSAPSTPAPVAATEAAPLRGRTFDPGHAEAGPRPPLDIDGRDRVVFLTQITAAARAACALQTVSDAQRAGYALSSFNTQGVGVHWTNWRLVDARFDPARPSMLLYGSSGGGKLRLVGFSYWVRSHGPPVGFAGSADQWHRHFGLCFNQQGLLESEGLRDARQCVGSWINGTDLWMLHAWIVPGRANTWGLFAPLNPQLCSRYVADVIRCHGVG